MAELSVAPLGPEHDRGGFSCGVEALDRYLRTQATQDLRKRVAVVFVATPDGTAIAGYYTLSQYSVELGALPQSISKRLPCYPLVPATLIGRLAVSTAFRGKRVGELLLMDALRRCCRASHELASAAVIVDAKDEAVEDFYLKYRFIKLPAVSGRLFLPMATIEKLFA